MTLLSRAKAMPLPMQDLSRDHLYGYTADQLRAAREQIAAEGDEVIAKLCEALEAVQREFIDGHISASLWTDKQAEADLMVRAALAEARKA